LGCDANLDVSIITATIINTPDYYYYY